MRCRGRTGRRSGIASISAVSQASSTAAQLHSHSSAGRARNRFSSPFPCSESENIFLQPVHHLFHQPCPVATDDAATGIRINCTSMRQSRHLLVTNLPDSITEDRISEHFKRCVSASRCASVCVCDDQCDAIDASTGSLCMSVYVCVTSAEWFRPRQPAARLLPHSPSSRTRRVREEKEEAGTGFSLREEAVRRFLRNGRSVLHDA